MITFDSQGDIQRVILRLKRLAPSLGHNVTLIDASDIRPPACNLFGLDRALLNNLSPRQQERFLNVVNETFMIIFSGFFGTELTPLMRLVFQYLTLLMMEIENANIDTLLEILSDPTPYMDYLDRLPPTAQSFLEELFSENTQYRQQMRLIRARLHMIIVNPTFQRIFGNTENKFDLGAAMNKPGHLTIINTSRGHLQTEASAIFGRFWLARIFQETMARAFIPRTQRRLCVTLVDEAHEYLQGAEDTVSKLLYQARKYAVSINLIHQDCAQLRDAGVLGSVLGVPALRFTGAISDADAQVMAREMHTTPEFLRSVRRTNRSAEWAVYARNVTPTATKTTIDFLEAERAPKMTDQEYQWLLELNRRRVGTPRRPQNLRRNNPDVPPNNDGDGY